MVYFCHKLPLYTKLVQFLTNFKDTAIWWTYRWDGDKTEETNYCIEDWICYLQNDINFSIQLMVKPQTGFIQNLENVKQMHIKFGTGKMVFVFSVWLIVKS